MFGGGSGGGTGGEGFGLTDCNSTDYISPSLPEPETDTAVEVPATNECVVGTLDCFGNQQLIIRMVHSYMMRKPYNSHLVPGGYNPIDSFLHSGSELVLFGDNQGALMTVILTSTCNDMDLISFISDYSGSVPPIT